MKKFSIVYLLMSLLLAGCGQTLSGKVTLTGDREIPVVDRGGSRVTFGAGPMLLNFKGTFKPKLEISQGAKTATVKLPHSLGLSVSDHFYIEGSRIGQKVDLEGQTQYEDVQQFERIGDSACFTAGYCYKPCGAGNFDPACNTSPHAPPYTHPGGSYGYHFDCPGVMRVKLVYQRAHEIFSIGFRDTETLDKPLLGIFDSDRGVVTRLIDQVPLTACLVY